MKVKMTADGKVFEAALSNSSLVDLLPLEVDVEDYAATEKIFYLPKKLSIEGAPAGYEPKAGDICYYAPWGNIAIFYKGFSYSKGLIKVGEITNNLENLKSVKNSKIKIEIMK